MDKIIWKTEIRKLKDLILNETNPRCLSKKRAKELKESISSFGFCDVIVIQPNNKIISGHQRCKILLSLGHHEVEVKVPSRTLSSNEEKQLTIIMNKVQGEFDFDILANHYEPIMLLGCGFTEKELYAEHISEEIKPKKMSINLKFENEDDLRHFEKELTMLLDLFPTVNMKVRCK